MTGGTDDSTHPEEPMNAIVRATDVDLNELQRTAKLLAYSGYFGTAPDPQIAIAQIATKILAGRELGYGPFASVNGIHIVSGKPTLSANLMAAAVKAHPRYDYRVRKNTNEEVVIEFFEAGDSLGISSFSEADAKSAGLLEGKNAHTWRNYRRNMLFARAMSNGVRWYCPDVFNGNTVYTPEELDMSVNMDADGNYTVIEPPNTPERPVPVSTSVDTAMAPQTPQALDISSQEQDLPSHIDDVAEIDPNPSAASGETGASAQKRYAHLGDTLVGDCRKFADWCLSKHAASDGPATDKQYQYLAGVLDNIAGAEGAHNAILEVLTGRPTSSANPPGFDLASKLLDWLVEERTETVMLDGVEQVKTPNPNYAPRYAGCIKRIYELTREVDGQQRLLEVA